MLILSRKIGEQIVIGDDITITIVAIDRDKVKVGVTGPKNIPVDRFEVRDRKNAAKK